MKCNERLEEGEGSLRGSIKPYIQGKRAFEEGFPKGANPYNAKGFEAAKVEWDNGWSVSRNFWALSKERTEKPFVPVVRYGPEGPWERLER